MLVTLVGIWAVASNTAPAAGEKRYTVPLPSPNNGRITPVRDRNGIVPDSWWKSLPLNQWIEVVGTDFESHVTPLLPPGYVDYSTGKLGGGWEAWTGAAIDRANGLMWTRNGGHGDGMMNGIPEFNLKKLQWRFAVQPTIYLEADMREAYQLYEDSYNMRQRLLAEGKATEANKYSSVKFAAWNRLDWNFGFYPRSPTHPNGTDYWKDGHPTAQHTYRVIEWNPDQKLIYSGRSHHMWKFNPVTGEVIRGAPMSCGNDSSMIYDEVTKKFFCFRFGSYDYHHYQTYDTLTDAVSPRKSLGAHNNGKPRHVSGLNVGIVGRDILCVNDQVMDIPFMYAWKLNMDTETVTDFRLVNPPPKLQSGNKWLATTHMSSGDMCDGKMYILQKHTPPGIHGAFTVIDATTGECNTWRPNGTPPPYGAPHSPYSKFRMWQHAGVTLAVVFQAHNANLRIARLA